MRTLFFLTALSFHIALSFKLTDKMTHTIKEIVHDLKDLSSKFVSTLPSTHSFILTCECDMHAMKHLKELLENVEPESVPSIKEKELLGRIMNNMDAVAPKKGAENCSRHRRHLQERAPTEAPYLKNLQHWLRKCGP